jgi:hypothetical protein
MKFLVRHHALSLCGVAMLLTACGGGQPSLGPPAGAIPQARAIVTNRVGSWVSPEAERGDLLYVLFRYYGSKGYVGEAEIYTFPGARLVGKLTGFSDPHNICSDANGNVWIMDYGGSDYLTTLHEFAHGSTEEIATLSDPDGTAQACAVDPTTGNLAVANLRSYGDYGANVLVYPNAQEPPTEYGTVTVDWPRSATYDDAGDLFVAGQVGVYGAAANELKKGSSAFQLFKPKPFGRPHIGAEWGDGYLTDIHRPYLINRYRIKNGDGFYVGSMTLDVSYIRYFLVHDRYLVASDGSSSVYFFKYPSGGNPITTIGSLYNPGGIALSVRPAHR